MFYLCRQTQVNGVTRRAGAEFPEAYGWDPEKRLRLIIDGFMEYRGNGIEVGKLGFKATQPQPVDAPKPTISAAIATKPSKTARG